ncbi:MAG: helix-turn-helix transcriptional regulator [Planctomycetes bacterium]|nr:helix-turn-helix transcriptional regulator [Planctomycetota bacterium]
MDWPRFARASLHGTACAIHAGRSTKLPSHSWGPQGRDLRMHGFLILERGYGTYRDGDGRRQQVQAGDVFLLFPGLRHEYGPGPGCAWEESFLDCSSDLAAMLERQGLLDRRRPVMRPAPAALAPLRQLINDIESRRMTDPVEAQWRLHGAILSLLRWQALPDDGDLERARALLSSEPGRAMDAFTAAAAIGLDPDAFRKRFRARYGVPPGRFRMAIRCEEAARLLLAGGDTVDDIAAALGFCDGAHLRRQFRLAMGLSPKAFRRQHGWTPDQFSAGRRAAART